MFELNVNPEKNIRKFIRMCAGKRAPKTIATKKVLSPNSEEQSKSHTLCASVSIVWADVAAKDCIFSEVLLFPLRSSQAEGDHGVAATRHGRSKTELRVYTSLPSVATTREPRTHGCISLM